MSLDQLKIAVIGLGYVGLPLATEFGKRRAVIGFDSNAERVAELQNGIDSTLEVTPAELLEATFLKFTHDLLDLAHVNCFIVAVPTPIDIDKRPNLSPLFTATEMVGSVLKKGDVVIYESTVYPGCTEDDCVPILERCSGLCFNKDFFCGYSPERVNPGDKEHRVTNVVKVTSGSTPDVANVVDALYREIVRVGTHKAPSIRVAEAAKVIENTQRDLNIALTNELAIIFNQLGIDTQAVLEAAGSKWNFLPFRPGLVGGHCIGVDPYYLTHKAQMVGYYPQIILAGRRLNEGMASYVAMQLIKAMVKKEIKIHSARILILGLSFKENCPDVRNTKVIDIIRELQGYCCSVDVHDPLVDTQEVRRMFGIELITSPQQGSYDALVLAVAHEAFIAMDVEQIRAMGKASHVLYDLKYLLPEHQADLRL